MYQCLEIIQKNINNQVNAKKKLKAIDLYSNGCTQQPVNPPNNPVLDNNSTQQHYKIIIEIKFIIEQ